MTLITTELELVIKNRIIIFDYIYIFFAVPTCLTNIVCYITVT